MKQNYVNQNKIAKKVHITYFKIHFILVSQIANVVLGSKIFYESPLGI